MPRIRFRSSFTVPNLLLNPKTSYQLDCRDSTVEIHLWNSDVSDRSTRPRGPDKIVQLDVYQIANITEKRSGFLHELEAKILSADDCPKPEDANGYSAESPAKSSLVKFDDLPNPLQELSRELRDDWIPIATQALRLLRWRYGKWCHFVLTPKSGLHWENSETHDWFLFPCYVLPPGEFGRIESGMSYHEPVKLFLENAINTNESEPIGHSLLQQAFELRDPRASIVLAVSAIEVAIKSLIGDRVNGAEWLAFNLPSPPIEKILQEYVGQLFPEISEDEYHSIFSKEIIQALRKYVTLRNAVAHRGQNAIPTDAWKACDCMRDILFRLDYLAGNKWAKYYWKTPSEYGTNEGIIMTPHSSVNLRADFK